MAKVFPALFGECCKDEHGEWKKGPDRTFKNLSDNQKSWCESSGDRAQLKDFKNVEFQPLLTPPDPNTKVIHLIPPPPLHLILLGRAAKRLVFLQIIKNGFMLINYQILPIFEREM